MHANFFLLSRFLKQVFGWRHFFTFYCITFVFFLFSCILQDYRFATSMLDSVSLDARVILAVFFLNWQTIASIALLLYFVNDYLLPLGLSFMYTSNFTTQLQDPITKVKPYIQIGAKILGQFGTSAEVSWCRSARTRTSPTKQLVCKLVQQVLTSLLSSVCYHIETHNYLIIQTLTIPSTIKLLRHQNFELHAPNNQRSTK